REGITNNGEIAVGDGSGELRAELYMPYDHPTIAGSGTVILHGMVDNPGLARIDADEQSLGVTFGPNQVLAGIGVISAPCHNEGRLSPGTGGDAIGVIQLQAIEWTETASSGLIVDLAGTQPAQYDRITGNGTVDLDGALVVRLVGSFIPRIGDEFT